MDKNVKTWIEKLKTRWNHKQVNGWKEGVLGRLAAENLSITSPWKDINCKLSNVVCPDLCIAVAYLLKKERKGWEI